MLRLLLLAFSVLNVSIYSLSFQTFNQNSNLSNSFNQYHGKKILLVNIATQSPKVNQLAGLQQLYNQYSDSLIIIAFPSNSFNNEPRSNLEIKNFCQDSYGINFPIALKANVTSGSLQSTYQWLADSSMNGVMSGNVIGDYQKFLIDKNGLLIGVFAPTIEPTDSVIINAITNND